MQPIRLFFPLFTARQLITGANSAYRQEINKLRHFAMEYIQPYLPRTRLIKYPYKFTITFYVYEKDDFDILSCSTVAQYILSTYEGYGALQSTDYRVIPEINIQCKKIISRLGQGCSFCFEHTTVEKPDYHF